MGPVVPILFMLVDLFLIVVVSKFANPLATRWIRTSRVYKYIYIYVFMAVAGDIQDMMEEVVWRPLLWSMTFGEGAPTSLIGGHPVRRFGCGHESCVVCCVALGGPDLLQSAGLSEQGNVGCLQGLLCEGIPGTMCTHFSSCLQDCLSLLTCGARMFMRRQCLVTEHPISLPCH